ncbi:MAG: hypothetical protein EHM85_05895 [Desulfobacteraceae bacterium]|nr:MAG: hypothetical protein EHM85_05895 [Desulfobacteraceae bacterium]
MERPDTAGSGGQAQPRLTAYERAIRSEGGLGTLRDADTLRSRIDDIKERYATRKVGKELVAERGTTDNARAERERIERNAVFPKTITFRSTKRDSLSSDAYGKGNKITISNLINTITRKSI